MVNQITTVRLTFVTTHSSQQWCDLAHVYICEDLHTHTHYMLKTQWLHCLSVTAGILMFPPPPKKKEGSHDGSRNTGSVLVFDYCTDSHQSTWTCDRLHKCHIVKDARVATRHTAVSDDWQIWRWWRRFLLRSGAFRTASSVKHILLTLQSEAIASNADMDT